MNRELAAELRHRAETDQAARRHWLATGEAGDLQQIDADNTAWLERVIAEHGWPGICLQPQLYGTQYTHEADGRNLRPQPIAEPEYLDERRAAMGLEPHTEYDRRMREE